MFFLLFPIYIIIINTGKYLIITSESQEYGAQMKKRVRGNLFSLHLKHFVSVKNLTLCNTNHGGGPCWLISAVVPLGLWVDGWICPVVAGCQPLCFSLGGYNQCYIRSPLDVDAFDLLRVCVQSLEAARWILLTNY